MANIHNLQHVFDLSEVYSTHEHMPKEQEEVLGVVDTTKSLEYWGTYYRHPQKYIVDFVRRVGLYWMNRDNHKVVVTEWAYFEACKVEDKPCDTTEIDSKTISEQSGRFRPIIAEQEITEGLNDSDDTIYDKDYARYYAYGVESPDNTIFNPGTFELAHEPSTDCLALPLAEEQWVNSFALKESVKYESEKENTLPAKAERVFPDWASTDEKVYKITDEVVIVYDPGCNDLYVKDLEDNHMVIFKTQEEVELLIKLLQFFKSDLFASSGK
jgi:hypothetical protein